MFKATTKKLLGSLTTSAPKKKKDTPSPATPAMGETTAPAGTMSNAANLGLPTTQAPRKSEGGLRLRMSLHSAKRQVAPPAAVPVASQSVQLTSSEVFEHLVRHGRSPQCQTSPLTASNEGAAQLTGALRGILEQEDGAQIARAAQETARLSHRAMAAAVAGPRPEEMEQALAQATAYVKVLSEGVTGQAGPSSAPHPFAQALSALSRVRADLAHCQAHRAMAVGGFPPGLNAVGDLHALDALSSRTLGEMSGAQETALANAVDGMTASVRQLEADPSAHALSRWPQLGIAEALACAKEAADRVEAHQKSDAPLTAAFSKLMTAIDGLETKMGATPPLLDLAGDPPGTIDPTPGVRAPRPFKPLPVIQQQRAEMNDGIRTLLALPEHSQAEARAKAIELAEAMRDRQFSPELIAYFVRISAAFLHGTDAQLSEVQHRLTQAALRPGELPSESNLADIWETPEIRRQAQAHAIRKLVREQPAADRQAFVEGLNESWKQIAEEGAVDAAWLDQGFVKEYAARHPRVVARQAAVLLGECATLRQVDMLNDDLNAVFESHAADQSGALLRFAKKLFVYFRWTYDAAPVAARFINSIAHMPVEHQDEALKIAVAALGKHKEVDTEVFQSLLTVMTQLSPAHLPREGSSPAAHWQGRHVAALLKRMPDVDNISPRDTARMLLKALDLRDALRAEPGHAATAKLIDERVLATLKKTMARPIARGAKSLNTVVQRLLRERLAAEPDATEAPLELLFLIAQAGFPAEAMTSADRAIQLNAAFGPGPELRQWALRTLSQPSHAAPAEFACRARLMVELLTEGRHGLDASQVREVIKAINDAAAIPFQAVPLVKAASRKALKIATAGRKTFPSHHEIGPLNHLVEALRANGAPWAKEAESAVINAVVVPLFSKRFDADLSAHMDVLTSPFFEELPQDQQKSMLSALIRKLGKPGSRSATGWSDDVKVGSARGWIRALANYNGNSPEKVGAAPVECGAWAALSLVPTERTAAIQDLTDLYPGASPASRQAIRAFCSRLEGPQLTDALLLVARHETSGLEDTSPQLAWDLILDKLPTMAPDEAGTLLVNLLDRPTANGSPDKWPREVWAGWINRAPEFASPHAFQKLMGAWLSQQGERLEFTAKAWTDVAHRLPAADRDTVGFFAHIAAHASADAKAALAPLLSTSGSESAWLRSMDTVATMLPRMSRPMQSAAETILMRLLIKLPSHDAETQNDIIQAGLKATGAFRAGAAATLAATLGTVGPDGHRVTLRTPVLPGHSDPGQETTEDEMARRLDSVIRRLFKEGGMGGAAVLSALASRYVATEDTFQQGDQIFQDLLPELGGQGLSQVLENLYLSDAKAGDKFMALVDPDDLPRGPALGHLVATRCLVSPKDGARMLNEFHKRLTTRAAGNEGLQIAVEALCLADPELGKIAVETYVDQLEPSAVLMDAGEGKAVRKEDIESRTAKRWAQRRAELAEGLWGLVATDPKTARGLGGQAFAAPAA